MPTGPRTCIIISYWTGRPRRNLDRLLRQTSRIPAGAPFDTLIVCNGGDERPLTAGHTRAPRVLNRPNEGYNIGAWEAGWRDSPGFDFYLFLQDECFIKGPGWLAAFESRMDREPHLGLLGESIQWNNLSWPHIRANTDRDLGKDAWPADEPTHPLDQYQSFLASRGIPKGPVGTHLQSLVLFARRTILEEVGGFPVGNTYREAVGCEIGISRLIASRGYQLATVRDKPYSLIGHIQWTAAHQRYMRARKAITGVLRRLGLKK